MDESVLWAIVIIAVNGVFDAVFVAWLAGYRSKKALEKWLESAASEEALAHILTVAWNWFVTSSIPTGKETVTVDEDGVEHKEKEKAPPYVVLARSIGQHLKMTLLGKVGGDANKEAQFREALRADLQDPNNPFAGIVRSALPSVLARAQKTGDYAPLAQLVLGNIAQEWLKKRQNQPPTAAAASAHGGDLHF
jgi:hypothetical protein